MATNNITFPIYNADGTPFNGLVLRNATFDSVVMSLGDKITGDVYYRDNTLAVTMSEYIEYKQNEDDEAVKFVLVNPPTIVREGMVSDNSELKGMTKYSFVFYHPMCMLSNFPFSDVAVTNDEKKYLSEDKTFSWCGRGVDFLDKINKNLQGTQWFVAISQDADSISKLNKLPDEITPENSDESAKSNVLSFDKNTIADALKTTYDTWGVPFVIESIKPNEYFDKNNNDYYTQGKRFVVLFGRPSNEILQPSSEQFSDSVNADTILSSESLVYYSTNKILVLANTKFLVETYDGTTPVIIESTHGSIVSSYAAEFPNDTYVYLGKTGSVGIVGYSYISQTNKPFVFRFGQGVGLKNNSRTPKNNKIVTRIVGYGSERNIPYGYPQIPWYGDQSWDYTIDNDSTNPNSYPIYRGIYGGQYIKLIKHPFTRKNLMPSVYVTSLFNKVSPYNADGSQNVNYNPSTQLVDYYDADNSYPNPAVVGAESVEIHQFENVYPQMGSSVIVSVSPYDKEGEEYKTYEWFINYLNIKISEASGNEFYVLSALRDTLTSSQRTAVNKEMGYNGGSYTYSYTITSDDYFWTIKYTSDNVNFNHKVLYAQNPPTPMWDDTMNDEGEYVQSYFQITLPRLDFDMYACASITEKMEINMRSGNCVGCTFEIYVDWEDYKANFYDSDGNFAPDGEQRNLTKYPKTNLGQVTFIVKKDLDTFGTLMPNTYQQPHSGDEFVVLGISLPSTYITNAEQRLDEDAKEYMRENNVHYYEYPLKFDEYFLTTHTDILYQIHNNTIVRFQYGNDLPIALYVKQITIKFGGVLPTYDITLTDDVEIVLNQIGQATDDISRMRVQVTELQKYYSENLILAVEEKLSKVVDDVCQGRITFQQGLDSIGNVIFHDELRSPNFTSGLYTGQGWRIDKLGNAEMESLRVRSYLEVVELLINRLQAQEGDTMFTDNDQIEHVEEKEYNNTTYYVLSLKEKWQGYFTSQQKDNILKGIINTLAANYGNVSDITEEQCVETDGINKYYTSWMKVIDPSDVGETLGRNQIAVILYEDTDTPANKNFPPCELMTVARLGCDADPDDETLTDSERQSIIRRQSVFSISTSDGRIAKLRGVRTPIMQNVNYGTTLGTIPDFIKQWSIYSRLSKNRDYLYAQGVIVSDFIKVDSVGDPITNYVDAGQWQNNTRYLHNAYNEQNAQWETNDVWHNGAYWRCLVTQPYNGVYYEPTDNNSAYWKKLMSSGDSTRQIYSYSSSSPVVPQQYEQDDEYTPSGWSNTPLALSQQHKDVYISTRKKHNGTWGQWSTPALFSHLAEDGTSISIKGYAQYLFSEDAQGNPRPQPSQLTDADLDDIDLLDYDDYQGDLIDVVEDNGDDTYIWAGYSIPLGSCYIWMGNNHLYQATENGWTDLGQIKGDKGDDGKNTATVFIYKRSASQPTNTDKPTSTITYSFADGSLSGNLNGWSAIIPQSDGNPCWVRQVFVSSDSPTVTIAPTSWSTANKYTEDGKNGVSVEAQYSPDTIQTHTTWQTGDLYMRTKMTNETNWSSWHKIVGESGDETEYTFNISKSLTSSNATTAPANCYYNTWQDAPVAPTSAYPYLWMKIVKKTWNESTQSYDSGMPSYARITGEKGENAFVVDLENEMKNVALTEGGNTLTAVDFYFKVQAFYGTSNVLSDNECTVSASCSDSNITLTTTAAKTTGIRVQVAQNVALANSTDITVTVTHTTYGTRIVVFTLAGVRGGENAILQELLPSLDAISFARQSDGSLTPASKNLDLSIKKTQGSQTIIQTISQSELTIRWSLSVMPAQPTSGSAWGQGTATGVTWSGNTMQIANSISAEHVCIAAFNSAGTLVDRETIPIVKDGQKGDDGEDSLSLVLDTYAIAFPTDSYYYVGSALTYTVGAKMFLGNNAQQTITSLTATSSDGDVYTSGTSPANGVKITIGESNFVNTVQITVTATCAKGSRTATINLTPTPQGEEGKRGKIGRFFNFGGTFDSLDSTKTFVVNDAQAPYFEHTETITTQSGTTTIKRYHVFNYDTNGTYTMSQMWTISSDWNSEPWESMTNDFKYIITEAIFGQFAHLGSFIISGDYFISQYGTLFYNNNGTIETTVINASNVSTLFGGSVAYAWFADSDPMVDIMPTTGSYKFRPTKCIDALSGEEWMAGGNVHVSRGGDVLVKGALMYHKVVIENSADGLALAAATSSIHTAMKGDIFIIARYYSVFNISFPPAYLFSGAMVKINITQDITYEMRVTRLPDEEAKYEDNQGEVYNGFINALDSTRGNWGVSYFQFTRNQYKSIELVAVENPVHRGYYVWMLIDAR